MPLGCSLIFHLLSNFPIKETLQTDRPDQLLGQISALASPSIAAFEEWFQKTFPSIHLPCIYSTQQKAGDLGVSLKYA